MFCWSNFVTHQIREILAPPEQPRQTQSHRRKADATRMKQRRHSACLCLEERQSRLPEDRFSMENLNSAVHHPDYTRPCMLGKISSARSTVRRLSNVAFYLALIARHFFVIALHHIVKSHSGQVDR